MATTVAAGSMRPGAAAPDTVERLLAAGSVVLLGCVAVALAKGRAEWGAVPWQVWPHLLTVATALALTPTMLLRPRGDRWHRRLGWLWAGSMVATALLSFDLRIVNDGRFSVIHLLSLWVLVHVPLVVWTARTHRVARHRRAVRGLVIGALLVAGFFTLPFGRLLGHWLFA